MTAPTIVFLHGLGGSPFSWDAQTSSLPTHWRASAPWLRGLRPGASGAAQRFDLADAAADVATPLQFDGPATLVGHGLGAKVALRAAIDFPDLVNGLLLAGPVPAPGRLAATIQRAMFGLMPRQRLEGSHVSKERVTEVIGELAKPESRHELAAVGVPVLVVVGDRDRLGRAEGARLASTLPRARLEGLPGAGVDVMNDAPEAFTTLVHELVAEAAAAND